MADKPLTDLQRRVLLGLLEMEEEEPYRYAFTPNEIGQQIGAKTVRAAGYGNGRGSGHRVFGAAQQIIPTLTSLNQRGRGLVASTIRDDGRSGTGIRLTDSGREKAKLLRSGVEG